MIKQIQISDFSGGIGDSTRGLNSNEFSFSSNFDIFTDPKRLIPLRELTSDTNDGSTATGMKQYLVKDFVYASNSNKLYGLGINGTGKTKIVYKANATSGNWTIPATSEGNGVVIHGCFIEFKDYLWGFQGTNQIWKWGLLSGTPSITDSVSTVASTITSVANGVINSLGDLYIAYNNVIVRVAPDTTTVTDSAKTVPTNYKITSMCNYGDYLAIGCSPINNYNGISKVFIWDYSATDRFQNIIDWGEGELRILEVVDGNLVGVTDKNLNNTIGIDNCSMQVKILSGNSAITVKEIPSLYPNGVSILNTKIIKNGRLLWVARIFTDDEGVNYYDGLWEFGRKNLNYNWALTMNITSPVAWSNPASATSFIQGIGNASNYIFITHSDDGSISKTSLASAFQYATAVYESNWFNFGEPFNNKRLEKICISSSERKVWSSLKVELLHDTTTTWQEVGTFTDTGNYSFVEFFNMASGVNFPSGKEFKFKLTSYDGYEIINFNIVATVLS
jgi:hypothetical protein